MRIRFWGVRGSIASPGPDTAAVGGNTSCVELMLAGERGERSERIVLDAGTGLRALGNHILANGDGPAAMTMLLSHYHWDHIQGLPFFVPVYMPGTELTIVGPANGLMSVREALAHQMVAPVFPVKLDDTAARLTTREVDRDASFDVGSAKVTVARGRHPGGVLAYRVEHEGRSVVYATDTEHGDAIDPDLRDLAAGADLLVYDAQYLPEEYPKKLGWGHSTYVAGAELARTAGVGTLVLYHHDPARTDAGVAAIEARARGLFASSIAAREGLVLDLERGGGASQPKAA